MDDADFAVVCPRCGGPGEDLDGNRCGFCWGAGFVPDSCHQPDCYECQNGDDCPRARVALDREMRGGF